MPSLPRCSSRLSDTVVFSLANSNSIAVNPVCCRCIRVSVTPRVLVSVIAPHRLRGSSICVSYFGYLRL